MRHYLESKKTWPGDETMWAHVGRCKDLVTQKLIINPHRFLFPLLFDHVAEYLSSRLTLSACAMDTFVSRLSISEGGHNLRVNSLPVQ